MTKRKPIPPSVQRAVLMEAGYRCSVPTCRTILAIDLHHLEPVAMNGGNDAANLLALCPTCHRLHHKGVIPAEALKVYKGIIVSLNQGISAEAKDLLLHISDVGLQQWFTADATLRFSGLIAAGLIHMTPGASSGSAIGPVRPYHALILTEKGQAVVDAWKKGDSEALERALAMKKA